MPWGIDQVHPRRLLDGRPGRPTVVAAARPTASRAWCCAPPPDRSRHLARGEAVVPRAVGSGSRGPPHPAAGTRSGSPSSLSTCSAKTDSCGSRGRPGSQPGTTGAWCSRRAGRSARTRRRPWLERRRRADLGGHHDARPTWCRCGARFACSNRSPARGLTVSTATTMPIVANADRFVPTLVRRLSHSRVSKPRPSPLDVVDPSRRAEGLIARLARGSSGACRSALVIRHDRAWSPAIGVGLGAEARSTRAPTRGAAAVDRVARRPGGRRTYASTAARKVFAQPSAASSSIAERELKTAGQIADRLGNMKGALMKLGQMASYLDEGLPEPMRLALVPAPVERTTDVAPSSRPQVIRTRSWERRPESRSSSNGIPDPIASASHRSGAPRRGGRRPDTGLEDDRRRREGAVPRRRRRDRCRSPQRRPARRAC